MSAASSVSRDGRDYAVFAAAAAVVLGGVLWLAGAVSALASGHRVPPGRRLAGLTAFAHLGDPSAAWRAPVGPPVVYWTITCAVLILVGGVVWLLRLFFRLY